MVGLAYLCAAIGVALLLAVGRRESHDSRGGTDVFRYPRVILLALAVTVPVIGALAALVYVSYPPQRPRGAELILFLGFFGIWILGTLYGYLCARSLRVEIDDRGLIVKKLHTKREVLFAEIRVIVIRRSIKGGAQLILHGEADRRLFTVGRTIQDFDSLLWLVRNRASAPGVVVRERDKWGKWSES